MLRTIVRGIGGVLIIPGTIMSSTDIKVTIVNCSILHILPVEGSQDFDDCMELKDKRWLCGAAFRISFQLPLPFLSF